MIWKTIWKTNDLPGKMIDKWHGFSMVFHISVVALLEADWFVTPEFFALLYMTGYERHLLSSSAVIFCRVILQVGA